MERCTPRVKNILLLVSAVMNVVLLLSHVRLYAAKTASPLSNAVQQAVAREALLSHAGNRCTAIADADDVVHFSVINLPRREDKLRCVAAQFFRAGISVNLIDGIDIQGTAALDELIVLSPLTRKYLHRKTLKIGHVGCLYAHIRFYLNAVALLPKNVMHDVNGQPLAVVFEDDVALPFSFREDLNAIRRALNTQSQSVDVILLSWYCNEDHWKECARNNPADVLKDSNGSIVKVEWFMGGGAYAVTRRGAQKLLNSFPCNDSKDGGKPRCSMAIDWHMSSMIATGQLVVYGAMPPLVTMGAQGANQRYGLGPLNQERFEADGGLCGMTYRSDTERNTAPPLQGDIAAIQTALAEFRKQNTALEG